MSTATVIQPSGEATISFDLRGSGSVTIYWGDGSDDTYALSASQTVASHTYGGTAGYTLTIDGVENVTELRNYGGGGENAWGGDIGEWVSLTYINQIYLNTISGTLPPNVTYVDLRGYTTIEGTIPSSVTHINVAGSNTLTGPAPPNADYIRVIGDSSLVIESPDDLSDDLTYFLVDNLSTESVDNAIKHAWSVRLTTGGTYTLNGGTAEAPTDTMAAIAFALIDDGFAGQQSFSISHAAPVIETDDTKTYNELVNSAPLLGFYPTGDSQTNAIIEGESTVLAAGPSSTSTHPVRSPVRAPISDPVRTPS